jgi:Tfp pilus assembly protein PilV
MTRRGRRGAQGGFSLVEVAISSLVLVVALTGLVVTTVYSRNLSESSRHLWHATNAASATLEDIRHQSTTRWSDVTNWDGMHCDYGIGDPVDPYAKKLAADVSSDASELDRSTGMWTTGATEPNFYFVKVHTSQSSDEFANALDFQTYVADRAGLKNMSEDNVSTEAGGGTPVESSGGGGGSDGSGGSHDPSPAATYITTTPTNVTLGGAKGDYKLSYQLTNGGTSNKVVTSVTITSTSHTPVGAFTLNGVSLYNNMAKAAAIITVSGVDSLLSSGLAPGPISYAFDSPKDKFDGQLVSVKLTFADGTSTTSWVKP